MLNIRQCVWIVVIAAVIAFAESTRADNGVIVIGDSQSSSKCSWAHQLDRAAPTNIQVHAQAGRDINEYWPSPDLVPWGDMDTVVIWMGANDLLHHPYESILSATQALVDELASRGFSVVYALPPVLQWPGWDTAQLRIDVQNTLQNAYVVDPPPVEMQPDGLHPTCDGHEDLAWWWGWTLAGLGV